MNIWVWVMYDFGGTLILLGVFAFGLIVLLYEYIKDQTDKKRKKRK